MSRFYKEKVFAGLLALLLMVAFYAKADITGADVLNALDNPSGVEFLQFEYAEASKTKHKEDGETWYEYNYDSNGNIIYNVKSSGAKSAKWKLQTKLEKNTMVQKGPSCLVSNGVENDCSSRIYLRVYGPGKFSVRVKTSTGFGDTLAIWLDGEEEQYYEGWDYDYSPGTDDWQVFEVVIPPGKATKGSQAGTYYHEIILNFTKDDDDDDGRPVKPNKSDYYGDTEWYKEDLEEYNAKLPFFNDCVWIDAEMIPSKWVDDEISQWTTVWLPDDITLAINTGEDTNFTGSLKVPIFSNAYGIGCVVRYTLDGKVPTGSSPALSEDGDTVLITQSCKVIAKVFNGTMPYSPAVTASCEFTCIAATPVISLDEGRSTADTLYYSITCETAGATIYYRINGAAEKTYSAPVGVSSVATITAVARVADGSAEESAEASVTAPQMAIPTVKAWRGLDEYVSGDILDASENVTVYCTAPDGGKAVYRLNNSGAWQDFPRRGLTISTNSVCMMRTESDGDEKILASQTVSLTVRKADATLKIGGRGADVVLRDGWNLIGLPMTLTAKSSTELSQKLGPLYRLDGNAYVQAATVEPNVGYWIYVSDANHLSTLTLNGVRNGTATVVKGWSLGGSVAAATADSVWEWTGRGFKAAAKTTEGRGYLIYKE